MEFKITGCIREKESGIGIPNLKVRAYDKDLIFDDLLGVTVTDERGCFEMVYSGEVFKDLFEHRPDIYLAVYSQRRLLLKLDKAVRWNASEHEHFDVEIDREVLGDDVPPGTPPADAPHLAKAIEQRESLKAEAALPEVMIEINRIWHGKTDVRSSLREVDGATVFEIPFTLKDFEPPRLAYDALDEKRLDTIEYNKVLPGFRPLHLAVNFSPRLIRHAVQEMRDGEDRPNAVFSPDTRYIFQDTSFPWCVTGKVETAGGSCTGTMIGRRLMLTASHCMQWNEDGAGWVKFTPGYYNGSAPFGIAWGQRVIYWNRAEGGLSDFETAFDYVVIVLDRNMGDLTGYAGYRTYSSGWNNGSYWQQIGYPGDLSNGERPAFFGGGSIASVSSESTSGQTGYVMGHFIDTFPGHSGGPYWGWWGEEPWPRVVGTDSASPNTPGTGTSGDNEAGGGPALSALITYARNNYP